ncbi:Cytochrome C oxidase, cbb3-type, subunit III [Marinobacterium lutimaris]|uniref:Cytochrome C oxidase, cbb3-type, subunit III n=2 Tax=Marinobacterium lutimaris TaxID=568106 RepID=A0A1H6BLY6_9GAMM|nr:Cytochrome C oxidase, cbb3-type, subunit III [Marinobacterium lutimaris]
MSGCSSKDPDRLSKGDDLYDYYCAACHEENNLGRYLEQVPLHQRQMQAYEIVLMLKQGYSGAHPEFSLPQLSDEQADAVARFAYSLPASADN